MSEESKTADADYVMMGHTATVPGRGSGKPIINLDDPNLTQEEKDHRLAVALQQQENAAALDEHQKKHQEHVQANKNRTARSGTFTKLAAVRDKDHGMLSVPEAYATENAYHKSDAAGVRSTSYAAPRPGASPQEIADFKIAAELQKVEQVEAGTVRTMEQIVQEEMEEEKAQAHRTERSNYHMNQKGLFKH